MSHEQIGKSNEWYTPAYVFKSLGCHFDMDVAHPVIGKYCNVPTLYKLTEKGLESDWVGFVWMNPPFGNQKCKYLWIDKFISHGNGIALFPDRTSTTWWQHLAKESDCHLQVSGKIKFVNEFGVVGESPSNGTTLFAIGGRAKNALLNAQEYGLGTVFSKI